MDRVRIFGDKPRRDWPARCGTATTGQSSGCFSPRSAIAGPIRHSRSVTNGGSHPAKSKSLPPCPSGYNRVPLLPAHLRTLTCWRSRRLPSQVFSNLTKPHFHRDLICVLYLVPRPPVLVPRVSPVTYTRWSSLNPPRWSNPKNSTISSISSPRSLAPSRKSSSPCSTQEIIVPRTTTHGTKTRAWW
jgi:hypothetical protein